VPYPFTYSTGIRGFGPEHGRRYYGPGLQDPRDQPPVWTAEPARAFYEDAHPLTNVGIAAGVAVGVGALGFIPTNKGRVWDWYVKGLRAVEEYSPGGVMRTFQLSSFFSQFETAVAKGTFIKPELLARNERYATYLSRLIGQAGPEETFGRLIREGATLRGGKLFWGEGQEVALRYASAVRVPEGYSTWLGAAWERIVGAAPAGTRDKAQQTFASVYPAPLRDPRLMNPALGRELFEVEGRTVRGMAAQVVGAQSAPGFAWRWARAWGTEWVSRFNRLLEAPAGFPIIENVYEAARGFASRRLGIQRPLSLAVREGTGLQMLGRMTWRYGMILPALYMGYQTVDWAMRGADLFEGTLFEEGLTTGIASLGVRANLLASQVAEATDLHRFREFQEEIAPGSTELSKLAAFPLMGGLAALGGLYAVKVGKMATAQARGLTVPEARFAVEQSMKQFGGQSWIAKAARRLVTEGGVYAEQGRLANLWRRIAEPTEEGILRFRVLGKMSPARLAGTLGIAAGAAFVLPFLPGALIPGTRPKELEALYEGRQEVPVRRGRWWEFGRTPYEGGRISYYRPHWYARMRTRAREKALWGDKAEKLSPLSRWWRQEFTYELERTHYKERPYPVTALPFEDVPFIGPILAGTIGRFIKPPRLMHTEDWRGEQGIVGQPPRFGGRIATEIGETAGGMPISPYDIRGTAGEQVYRLTELIGLPGFTATSIKEALTGTPDLFDQMTQLESARRMFGFERQYWDLELGGLLGTTEAFRRLYPHRRRQIPLYNPIRNTMPEWLPGPGEKSPDFWHGDPWAKVPEGELRLPGAGYAARYPELEGVAPGEYPLIHRFKILADVAPYTDKYGEHLRMVRAARKQPGWDDEKEYIFQQTLEQIKKRKTRVEFQEYQYLSPMGEIFGKKTYFGGEDSAGLIATINKLKASKEVETGLFAKTFGGYWELLSHNAETAFDQMTPISPGAKLVHTRTPVEHYQTMQVYGTESAFWSHPWRDFLRPTMTQVMESLGFEGIPAHIEERRELEEYFDVLKYVKFGRLANAARIARDWQAVKEFEARKDQSLFGMNPYTRNYTSIFRALPRRERDYFNAFSQAETEEERRRIFQLVPENERALYSARWKMAFVDEVKRAGKAGILSESQLEEADRIIGGIYEDAAREGLPSNEELHNEYLKDRFPGEGYADWYRRKYLLSDLESLPGPNWVGWHPSVDLDDIKLKVVQTLGEDMHDYDLWPSRARTLQNKPYINDQAVDAILEPQKLSRAEMRDRIDQLFLKDKMRASVFSRTEYRFDNEQPEVSVNLSCDWNDDDQIRTIKRMWQ
jgi:hypothetical protein